MLQAVLLYRKWCEAQFHLCIINTNKNCAREGSILRIIKIYASFQRIAVSKKRLKRRIGLQKIFSLKIGLYFLGERGKSGQQNCNRNPPPHLRSRKSQIAAYIGW